VNATEITNSRNQFERSGKKVMMGARKVKDGNDKVESDLSCPPFAIGRRSIDLALNDAASG